MIQIKLLETDDDKEQKAYVHWQTWQETYEKLLPSDVMETYTLDRCRDLTFRYPDNTLIATIDGKVIGFASFGLTDNDQGEVFAIYLLKDYHGHGLGYQLLQATLEKLRPAKTVSLWVLADNKPAISFYERCGFVFQGETKIVDFGIPMLANRMLLER